MVDIGQTISPDQFEAAAPEEEQQPQDNSPIASEQAVPAAIEGATRGILPFGIGATLQHEVMGTPKEDILAREKAHPVAAGLGEVAGMLAPGFGAGAGAKLAGEAVGTATEGAGIIRQIGSPAAKLAIENALLTSGSEVDKMALKDPDTTAENALANVGMAGGISGVLGGIGGGSKALWKSTLEPKANKVLNAVIDHFGGAGVDQEALKSAEALGVPLTDLQKGLFHSSPSVQEQIGISLKNKNPEMLDALESLKTSIGDKADAFKQAAKDVNWNENITKVQQAQDLLKKIPDFKALPSETKDFISNMSDKVPDVIGNALGGYAAHQIFAGEDHGKAAEIGEDLLGAYAGKHLIKALAPFQAKLVPAARLAFVKFLSSDVPPSAAAFKTMTDYFGHAVQFNKTMGQATKNLLAPGIAVLAPHLLPTQQDRDKLEKNLEQFNNTPGDLAKTQQDSNLGHYLPDHQTATTMANIRAQQYLQQLKPKVNKPGPLDAEIQPSEQQLSRYKRAQDIATQPLSVLQHAKDGTLQASDIADLQAMWPKLYPQMVNSIIQNLNTHVAAGKTIPYKSRVGISLLSGQQLDSTMTPGSIQAAQPKPQTPPQQQAQNKATKGSRPLTKVPGQYKTPEQAAESDRSSRD